jgi:hypothetical protein
MLVVPGESQSMGEVLMCEVEVVDIVRRERALARQDETSGVKVKGTGRLGDSSAVLCKRKGGEAPRLGSEELCKRRVRVGALCEHEEYIRSASSREVVEQDAGAVFRSYLCLPLRL